MSEPQTLADLEPIIYSHLDAIKRLFKPGYKATLVLRNPKLAKRGLDCGVFVTDDDPEEVIKEIRAREGL